MCREGSAELSRLRPELDSLGVRLIAVGHERLGLEEFVEGKFFDGDIYLNTDKSLYKALGAKRAGVFSMAKPSMWKAVKRAKAKKFDGNMAGDGFQLGGLMVLEPSGAMVYRFTQSGFGDHPPLAEVLAAAREGAEADAPVAELGAEDLAAGEKPPAADAADVEEVRRLAAEGRVHVFAHSRCPYSDRAKRVFGDSLGVPFGVTDLDLLENGRGAALRRALAAETGQNTFPWVFVDGKLVEGGGDGTHALFLDGGLDHLKDDAAAQ